MRLSLASVACLDICAAGDELLARDSNAKAGSESVEDTLVAGVKAGFVTGVKAKLADDETAAGVKLTLFSQQSVFVFGVEQSVKGVWKVFSSAIGDKFTSPSLQLSLSGLD